MEQQQQPEHIFEDIRSRLLRHTDNVDRVYIRTKMELLRETNSLHRLRKQPKSMSVKSDCKNRRTVNKLTLNEQPQPQTERQEVQPAPPLMYRTLHFQHTWGGMPVKAASHWMPTSNSPKCRLNRKLSMPNRPINPEIIKLLPPKFQLERANILNKNNLYLVPFLKSKIKHISNDINVACVGDIPISYNYPQLPSKKQTSPQKLSKRPTISSRAVFEGPAQRVSVDSIKEIGPW